MRRIPRTARAQKKTISDSNAGGARDVLHIGCERGSVLVAGFGIMNDLVVELYEKIAPELADCERFVRDAEPSLNESEVLDRALRRAVARLRFDLASETFERLRWRFERAREETSRTRQAARDLRQTSAALRQESAEARLHRMFQDGNGMFWHVREVATLEDWARAPHCLVFEAESVVRRVWEYPLRWYALSDADLERLVARG
jgi:hypothetical protein